jgi:FKBP-type peptidyl-prolyl cis-trans isomerase SlpA
MMSGLTVAENTHISLHFSLSLDDGSVVDSNFEKAPAQFVFGDGSLLPAFEQALLGLRAGDKKQVVILAVDAFGRRQEANLKRVAREKFAADIQLVAGLVVSFAAGEGGELPGVIHRLMGDMIEVDFNHPLAGRDIVFAVEIVSVNKVAVERVDAN